jgi:hypothetical protein
MYTKYSNEHISLVPLEYEVATLGVLLPFIGLEGGIEAN